MTTTEIRNESVIFRNTPEDGALLLGHASIVVPIRLWRRIRSLLAMHDKISREMIHLEQDGVHEHTKKPIRASLIRDIARADGNETQNMDTQTVETMYGGIADTILARYNVSVRKERKTNGTQPN